MYRGLAEQKRSDVLQRRHALQLIDRGLHERFEQPPAGGIEGDVDFAAPGRCEVEQRINLILLGDVAGSGHTTDLRGEVLQLPGLTPGHDNPCPFGAEAPGDDLPHVVAPCRTQYHRDLALQFTHGPTLLNQRAQLAVPRMVAQRMPPPDKAPWVKNPLAGGLMTSQPPYMVEFC
ncbi:hypothetical protein D3C80_1357520 [compost metagenome]